ncbi:MAG: N,N-dimethylformamidase beta subunit family domain-containing protein [Gammaproteobacteria bacterium]
MVNAIDGGQYTADLVRIVNGDFLSRYKKHFKLLPVDAPFAGDYDGVEQALNLGSYVEVPGSRKLDGLKSFTVAAWIYPTFDPNEYQEPDLENPDPFYPPTLNIGKSIGEQAIVSRFDAATNTGWALRINKAFQLEFIVGDGTGVKAVTIPDNLKDWDWSYVAASYDADSGEARVLLLEKPYAPGDQFTARNLSAEGTVGDVTQAGPLRIAAVRNGKGAVRARFEKPGHVFNGRIQDARLADKVLSDDDIEALSAAVTPKNLNRSLVADWNFAEKMKSAEVVDIRGKHNGELINIAERAVRGRFWSGDTVQWRDKPEDYSAITFHADDLYDAEWGVDFTYIVPDDLASGLYAARLKREGDTDELAEYIVFFVAPEKGKANAKLALWISDNNYLAYQNVSLGATAKKNYPGHWFNERDNAFYIDNPEYATGGVYNQHADGQYFHAGSRLRPDICLKPSGCLIYTFTQDTHITSFLEHEGIDYDIITDELVDKEGLELLSQYTAIVTSTHPEYVPGATFDAIGDYTANGGRFIYLGANGYFWAVDEIPGFPGTMESRNFHKMGDRYLTSGSRGGLMVETGRKTGPLVGIDMGGMIFNGSSPYRKLPAADDPRASWIFAGTDEGAVFGDYGLDQVHGGVVGFEIDRFNAGNGVPRHALNLATSEPLRETIEDVIALDNLPINIVYHPSEKEVWAQADVVYFETPNGGAVFTTGSINWISATLDNDYDNDVAVITRNVINRFLDPKPFPPVAANDVPDVDRLSPNPEYEHADQR